MGKILATCSMIYAYALVVIYLVKWELKGRRMSPLGRDKTNGNLKIGD